MQRTRTHLGFDRFYAGRFCGKFIAGAAGAFAYALSFSLAYLSLSAGTGALILFGAVQATISLRKVSKLYWVGGSVVSALAISFSPAPFPSPPVAEVFASVPAADPVFAAPAVVAFAPLLVSVLVPSVLVSVAQTSRAVSALVSSDLVSFAQIHHAVSCSFHFPSYTLELSINRTGVQTVLHVQLPFFNSFLFCSKHFMPGYNFAAQARDHQLLLVIGCIELLVGLTRC